MTVPTSLPPSVHFSSELPSARLALRRSRSCDLSTLSLGAAVAVGLAPGVAVWVGASVGACVGALVGACVGSDVGSAVGAEVCVASGVASTTVSTGEGNGEGVAVVADSGVAVWAATVGAAVPCSSWATAPAPSAAA